MCIRRKGNLLIALTLIFYSVSPLTHSISLSLTLHPPFPFLFIPFPSLLLLSNHFSLGSFACLFPLIPLCYISLLTSFTLRPLHPNFLHSPLFPPDLLNYPTPPHLYPFSSLVLLLPIDLFFLLHVFQFPSCFFPITLSLPNLLTQCHPPLCAVLFSTSSLTFPSCAHSSLLLSFFLSLSFMLFIKYFHLF